ncbi:MAG TPA: NfeD family protein [Rubricoccaceae bacterium]|nr:NfeD family protein [Rubricoccaceae bacterium]
MIEVYWVCLLGGLVFSVLAVLFGDLLDGVLDGLDGVLHGHGFGHALDALSMVGGLTVFGGAGVLLETYADLGTLPTALASAAAGLVLAVVMHFAYVRPMKRGENSTAFSVREYAGKIGEVNTAIPARGYGEVLVRMGASVTFQPAASFDGTPIPVGTTVVVVEVEPDGSLLVAPLEDEPDEPVPLPSAHAPRLPEPVA